MKKYIMVLLSLFLIGNATAQTPINVAYATDLELLIANFIESGVTVSNIVHHGDSIALGSFSQGEQAGLGVDNGIILSSGNVMKASGSASFQASTNTSGGWDPDLANLSPGNAVKDASVLEFDLIPEGNVLAFNFIFGSEEYPEYVGSGFNDMFGFFLTGQNPSGDGYLSTNIALIPGTELPVSIDNINHLSNSEYYVNNSGGTTLTYDGYTTVIPILVNVVPNQIYHLKIAIADCADEAYDSGVFLESPSLKSYTIIGLEEISTIQGISVYPSPVNENSVLKYTLEKDQSVTIKVYNLLGTEIETLVNSKQSKGIHYSSLCCLKQKGVYMISINADSNITNMKVVVGY